MGRPKLPKGQAKGKIVPVRFTPDELRGIDSSARLRKESTSEWLRRVLPREAKHKGYSIQLNTRPVQPSGYSTFGWIINQIVETNPIAVVPPGTFPTKEAALEAGIVWCRGRIDMGNTNDANPRL